MMATYRAPKKWSKPRPIKLSRRISPQAALVLDYLTAERLLTPLIAMTTLGVSSLTARIAELRGSGVRIDTIWEEDHTGRRYAKYKLRD